MAEPFLTSVHCDTLVGDEKRRKNKGRDEERRGEGRRGRVPMFARGTEGGREEGRRRRKKGSQSEGLNGRGGWERFRLCPPPCSHTRRNPLHKHVLREWVALRMRG